MNSNFFKTLIFGAAAITGICIKPTMATVTEAEVFDWWDSGIVTPEQAEEILARLDEGNESEACILAETYAQEPCEEIPSEKPGKKKKRTKNGANGKRQMSTEGDKSNRELSVHGHFLYKARFDSLGHLKSHREELELEFYRYTLRLGSQELLSYRNDGSEAHFGDISTQELHSQIPLDTLWGTALFYPIGNVFVGGMLDTSLAANGRIGYRFNKNYMVEGIYWQQAGNEARDTHAGELQTKFEFGETALWWQQGHNAPLAKAMLQGKSGKGKGNPNQPEIHWKTTAYVHGDSIPQFARLSSTIAGSRIWGSQAISGTAPELANTRITANARFLNPLHSDSVSMRLKASVQSGPKILRASAAATCLEASENCRDDDLQAGIESSLSQIGSSNILDNSFVCNLTIGTKIKTRYHRDQGLDTPQFEIAAKFSDPQKNFARVTAVWPRGISMEKFQLRNEMHLRNDFLDFSLATTFKASNEGSMHPSHAAITAKFLF